MTKYGYIYCLMDTKRGVCKIGLTENLKSRIRNLKNSNSSPEDLIYEYSEVEDMREAENYLHRFFYKKRIHGEWFKGLSFEDFWREINKYNAFRSKRALNTINFYKTIYSTDYEKEKGIPEKILELMKTPEYNIMIFKDKDFNDTKLMFSKLDTILSKLPSNSKINLTCANNYLKKLFRLYSGNRKTSVCCFTDWYYKDEISFTDMCLDQLEGCYGLVIFCKEENWLIKRLSIEANSSGIKVRIIKEPEIIRKLRVA